MALFGKRKIGQVQIEHEQWKLIMQNFLSFIFQKIIYCLFFNGVLKTIFNYNLISKAGFKPCYMSNTIVKQLLIFVFSFLQEMSLYTERMATSRLTRLWAPTTTVIRPCLTTPSGWLPPSTYCLGPPAAVSVSVAVWPAF